jgi:hypothetical protein
LLKAPEVDQVLNPESRHPRPLQNKVDPWGELRALRVVGTLMGNRGILHDENDRIVRNWANKSWVCCSLSATFQKRNPFSPGTYSELFFLDEATSYAAGHRPCRTCRRADHDRFNEAWTAANAAGVSGRGWLPIREIDAALHAERIAPDRRKRTHSARLGDLPVGAMFTTGGEAVLVGPNGLRLWSFGGYHPHQDLPVQTVVDLLTPPSVVAAIQQGLVVGIHPTGQ